MSREPGWKWPLILGAPLCVLAWLVVLLSPPGMTQKQCADVVEVVLENIKLRAAADSKEVGK